jgi:hypothetical protein
VVEVLCDTVQCSAVQSRGYGVVSSGLYLGKEHVSSAQPLGCQVLFGGARGIFHRRGEEEK